jgi:Mg-chelatase subunit ChlI
LNLFGILLCIFFLIDAIFSYCTTLHYTVFIQTAGRRTITWLDAEDAASPSAGALLHRAVDALLEQSLQQQQQQQQQQQEEEGGEETVTKEEGAATAEGAGQEGEGEGEGDSLPSSSRVRLAPYR